MKLINGMIQYVAVTGVDMHGITVEECSIGEWDALVEASEDNERGVEIEYARSLKEVAGTRSAAGFMCKAGWSVEAARYVLLGV